VTTMREQLERHLKDVDFSEFRTWRDRQVNIRETKQFILSPAAGQDSLINFFPWSMLSRRFAGSHRSFASLSFLDWPLKDRLLLLWILCQLDVTEGERIYAARPELFGNITEFEESLWV
jgi:hypothetical protein